MSISSRLLMTCPCNPRWRFSLPRLEPGQKEGDEIIAQRISLMWSTISYHCLALMQRMLCSGGENKMSTKAFITRETWNHIRQGVLAQGPMHETRDHLFFRCTYSSSLWRRLMRELLGNHHTEEGSSIILFMSQSQLSRTQMFLARYVFQTTLYMIWRERNSRKHGEKPRPPETLFRIIDIQVKNRTTSIRTQDKRLDNAFQAWIVAVGT
ncbi:hypothetical protein Bca4012_094650 [Brassica carinata]